MWPLCCRVAYNRNTFDEDISAWDVSAVSWINACRLFGCAVAHCTLAPLPNGKWCRTSGNKNAGIVSCSVVGVFALAGAANHLHCFDVLDRFRLATKFTGGDLSSWVTSSVTSMYYMWVLPVVVTRCGLNVSCAHTCLQPLFSGSTTQICLMETCLDGTQAQ